MGRRITKYTSSNAQELGRDLRDDKMLKRLYNERMASVEKRVSRIEKRYGERAVTSNVQKLPKSAEGLTRGQMLKGLAQANRYLKSGTSTITGYRKSLKAEQEGFREIGIDVTQKELISVNELLDEYRAKVVGSFYPSDYVVEMAKSASKAGMSRKQFIRTISNAEKRGMDKDQLIENFHYFADNPDLKRFYLKAHRRSSSDDY